MNPDQIISGFGWAVDSVDLTTADEIGRALVGPCGHWRDRPAGMTPLQMEILVLRSAGWRAWSGVSEHGKPYYRHLLAVIKLLLPKTDIHPSLADAANLFCQVVGNDLKGMHLIGSQNCLGEDVMVRMHGGGVKRADEVVVGDLLVGPDLGPREVLTTCSGEAEMYRVSPRSLGKPWTCTANHLVTVCGSGRILRECRADKLSWLPEANLARYKLRLVGNGNDRNTMFSIKEIGPGRFAGFEVDGDHRFLLEDGTITHNSGKTAATVRLSFAVMAVFPEEAAIYFANPFDSAADSTIWGEVEECYDEIMVSQPGLFPKSVKYALKKIELVPGVPKAGTMEIRNVKAVGKFKGSKTRKTGKAEGLIVVNIDEINEIYNHAFIRMFSNLMSQDGFVVQTSQNFKDPQDMGGRMTTPNPRHGGPGSFSQLSRSEHLWYSHGSSITMRLSGLRSPNMIAERTIYPYLFTRRNHDLLVEIYGENSPEYYSQCLSFPMDAEESFSVLPRGRINASRHDDLFYQIKGPMKRVAFCDPAFGGGDQAMYCWGEFGRISYLDAYSQTHYCDAILPMCSMRNIPIDLQAVVDEEVLERIAGMMVDTSNFKIGSQLSAEDQVALACREWNVLNGIPDGNFGYDFSMRPDMVVSMGRVCGGDTVAFDYNTKPLGYFIKSLGASSADCCRNRVDELAFLVSDVFANQRIRNGGLIQSAILQMSRSRYELRNDRRIVEKKRDYKGRWNNQSPNERDCLMGMTGMAYLRGFSLVSLAEQSRTEQSSRYMTGSIPSGRFKRRRGKRLKFA